MFRASSGLFLLFSGVIAIACVPSSWSGAQETDSPIQQHFLEAQRDQQQGMLDAAAHEYQAVLRLQPGLPEAYVNLGLVYYAQARFNESASALARAEDLRPGMRGVRLWLGIDDVRLHRPERGVALLREAIRQDPTDKLAQSWLATALWDAGQMDAALQQLRKATLQFPDDPDILFARGEAYGKAVAQQTEQLLEESSGTALSDRIYGAIYASEHNWTKAEGHLRRAVERDPSSLDARLELAGTLLELASIPAAQEQLNQAVALAPRSASALALSGEVLLLTKQTAEGLSLIEQAIEIDRSEALDALGLPVEDFLLQGNRSEAELSTLCHVAENSLQVDSIASPAKDIAITALRALAGDDVSTEAYRQTASAPSSLKTPANQFMQAVTAIHQHRYENAEPLLLLWLAAHPGDRTARYELILVRRRISMAQVARLLVIAPDSYHVHQLLGALYASREEDDKALAEYLAVAAARPDLPDVHFWLGHLYWKHGDADHALAELTRQLQLDPGHPEANGELGAVLVAESREKEAIPHLESAIQSKPDLWPAYPQLGRAYAIEKNYARAEEVLKRALTHDPDGWTNYQLGLVLRAEGKTAEATQAFARVRAIKNEKMAAPSSDEAADGGPKQ